MVDPCTIATLTISDTILLSLPQVTLTEELGSGSPQSVTWTSDIVSSSIVDNPDPCRPLTQTIFDITTWSEEDLDPAIFTLTVDDSVDPEVSTLSVATTDYTHAGEYKLRLRARYNNYALTSAVNHDFKVVLEVYGCDQATLTIDNSVLKSFPDLTFQQNIGDLTNSFSWTSSYIVTSSITQSLDPCGTITY